ncbi:Holliday junction branch migration protein RuvA [Congregibacter sp.]|uniref:Holliday junction branch migration protein RuvA n=1 Tax=Congregibacter sp. TaxID=2744308 RepID=UPI0039E71370
MIGRISGTLLHKQPPEILVDVAGVGYEVQVPMTTLFQLPALGEAVTLLTHHAVREDAQTLYGFVSERDRELFRHLIKVSGVGPKLALTILSGMDSDSFARAVRGDDLTALVALPGVGKKTAERLLIEMRDRLSGWLGQIADSANGLELPLATSDKLSDAEDALVSLGYKPAEAARLVARVDSDAITDSEELIRLALRSTVRSS